MMINMQENTSCDPPIDSWRAQPYRHPPDMAWGTLPANGTLSLARTADTEKSRGRNLTLKTLLLIKTPGPELNQLTKPSKNGK